MRRNTNCAVCTRWVGRWDGVLHRQNLHGGVVDRTIEDGLITGTTRLPPPGHGMEEMALVRFFRMWPGNLYRDAR